MISTLRKKSFVMIAAVIVWAAIQPGILSAQTSGVGCDGYTRVLWKATDGSIALWLLNSSLDVVVGYSYGPYDTWIPVAITVGCDNYTRMLWRNTDGTAVLWLVYPNLSSTVTAQRYGPYAGWTAESLSINPTNNQTRLIWGETQGFLAVFILDPTLNYITGRVYGPYFGYRPEESATNKSLPKSFTPGTTTPGTVDAQAAAAMETHTSSIPDGR